MMRFVARLLSLVLIMGYFSVAVQVHAASKSGNEQVKTLNSQGIYARVQGKQDEAIALFTKSIELDPADAESYSHRALSYGSSAVRKFDLALADLNKAIELSPDNGEYYFTRGLLYYQLGDIENTWKDIGTARALKYNVEKAADIMKDVRGRCADYFNKQGLEFFKNKEYDRAISYYDKALEARPDVSTIYTNRAHVYASKKEYDRAIVDYNKAIAIDPTDDKTIHDLGLAYAGKKDFDQAIACFNKMFEVSPAASRVGQYYNDRAVAYFFKKDYDECWNDVNKAKQLGYGINPQFLEALKNASRREK